MKFSHACELHVVMYHIRANLRLLGFLNCAYLFWIFWVCDVFLGSKWNILISLYTCWVSTGLDPFCCDEGHTTDSQHLLLIHTGAVSLLPISNIITHELKNSVPPRCMWGWFHQWKIYNISIMSYENSWLVTMKFTCALCLYPWCCAKQLKQTDHLDQA